MVTLLLEIFEFCYFASFNIYAEDTFSIELYTGKCMQMAGK